MALVIKTLKLGVHRDIHVSKRQAILDTQALYHRVIAFYQEFFTAHLGIFEDTVPYIKQDGTPAERHRTAQDLLTFAERHTLATPAHPDPPMPLIQAIPPAEERPIGLRQAAINHASGQVKSWLTAHRQWAQGLRKGGEPQLGASNKPVTYYADLVA